MAPRRKRSSLRARASTAQTTPKAIATTSAANKGRKEGKRISEHENLMSRVRDAGISRMGKKRRRPGKKLQAAENIGELGDALPELDEEEDEERWEGFSDTDDTSAATRRRRRRADGEGKIAMKSLKHRPGAMKRKRKMEGAEMDRFGRNLAQMAQPTESNGDGVGGEDDGRQRGKWTALREFIGKTMDKDKLFAGTGGLGRMGMV